MQTEDGASTTNVLVKFTVRHNADAHRLLANHAPLAPALHFRTRVIGDMFMIGMQYISGSEGVSLCDASLSPPALEAVRRDVS
jgi:hypothetical protein